MYYLDVSIYVVRKFTVQGRKTIFLKQNSIPDSESNCVAQTNEPNPF